MANVLNEAKYYTPVALLNKKQTVPILIKIRAKDRDVYNFCTCISFSYSAFNPR